jgi:hypothetical protein
MTTTSPASKLTVPKHTISAEELRLAMPKPQRLRITRQAHIEPPSVELMAELRGLLKQLHPDKPHPKYDWMSVLIIIHYETAKHPDGFALADAWSRRGKAYTGPARVRKFWNNIKPCPRNPMTIRTLRWMVDQKTQNNANGISTELEQTPTGESLP